MAKSSKHEVVRIKNSLNELREDDIILIHKYNNKGNFPYKVSSLTDELLNLEVISIHPKSGGQEYNYNAFLYIVK